MIYLDSCALVKLVVTEVETSALQRYLDGRRLEMVSSQLALAEVLRVVRRSCFDSARRLTVDQETYDSRLLAAGRVLDSLDLVMLDRTLLTSAGAFDDDPFIRTLDAVHLESAKQIGSALHSFVTYDKRLTDAAEKIGLTVVAPA